MNSFNQLQPSVQIAVISLLGVVAAAVIAWANATCTTWLKARADVRIARHNARLEYRKEVIGRYTAQLNWLLGFVRASPKFRREDIESQLNEWSKNAWSFEHPEIKAIAANDPQLSAVLKNVVAFHNRVWDLMSAQLNVTNPKAVLDQRRDLMKEVDELSIAWYKAVERFIYH